MNLHDFNDISGKTDGLTHHPENITYKSDALVYVNPSSDFLNDRSVCWSNSCLGQFKNDEFKKLENFKESLLKKNIIVLV